MLSGFKGRDVLLSSPTEQGWCSMTKLQRQRPRASMWQRRLWLSEPRQWLTSWRAALVALTRRRWSTPRCADLFSHCAVPALPSYTALTNSAQLQASNAVFSNLLQLLLCLEQ